MRFTASCCSLAKWFRQALALLAARPPNSATIKEPYVAAKDLAGSFDRRSLCSLLNHPIYDAVFT
jgi:hypothetical protein